MDRSRQRRRFVAVMLAAMAIAGCGSSDDDNAGQPAAATTAPGSNASTPVTEVGVTDSTIKVGVLSFDAQTMLDYGLLPAGYDADVEQVAWEVFIDDLNQRGGAAGRTVEVAHRVFKLEPAGDSVAKCVELAEDEEVFAVFAWGFLSADPILCVTEQHRTPLFKGDPESDQEVLERSDGYLSSTLASYRRQLQTLAFALHDQGLLEGKTVGVLGATDNRWADDVIEALESHGHTIEHVSRFPAADFETQIAGEVLAMKQNGVDFIVMASRFTANVPFVLQAESQGYFPQYAVTDIAGNSEDSTTQSMPEAFDGAIAITMKRGGEWRLDGVEESPADRECREIYEAGSGETIGIAEENLRFMVMMICSIVDRFEAAANAVEGDLTRDSLQEAIGTLGEVPLAFTGGGSYAPDKFDGADYWRSLEWDFDCKCWLITSDFSKSDF